MKLISIKKITDNMVLEKDICSGMGNILLPKGAQLKHNHVKRLQEWGVHSVYIQDNHSDRVEIDEELCQQTRDVIGQIMTDFLENTDGSQLPEPVNDKIREAIKQLLAEQKILPNLVEIKEFNENIFKHNVGVCILAVSMGVFSGYDSKRLQELAAGAILINSEQYGGPGFSKGLKGDMVHEYAKITAIADSYLSCQSNGIQGQKLQPPQALKYIEEHSGTLFDPEFSRLFSQKIAPWIVSHPNHFGDGSHDGVDSDRISGNDTCPDSKHGIMDNVGCQASPVVNQKQRQQVKDELLRIYESFLSKMDMEPVPEQVMPVIHSIIDELISGNGVMNHIISANALNASGKINPFNDKRIFHSMSVGFLAVMTGVALGYPVARLKELGTGAITLELEKTALFKESVALSIPEYFNAIFQYIQSGFEKIGLGKSNPDFIKIAGLADIYCTLTGQGIEGQTWMPHEVIEYVRDYGGVYFDPQLTHSFLQSITPFLIGTYVLLNTGEKAKILKIHKDILARPAIRVMVDRDGNKLAQPVEKDLEKDLTLFIVRVLTEDLE